MEQLNTQTGAAAVPADQQPMTGLMPLLRRGARAVAALEPLVLAAIIFAFWYPSPIRDGWLGLVALLPLVYLARWISSGRLHRRTPLDGWLIAFLILCVLNIWIAEWTGPRAAPYTRGVIMLSRPLMGVAMVLYFVRVAHQRGSMNSLLTATTWLALVVGLLALCSTQWDIKSRQLQFLIDALPDLRGFPGAEAGFNPNEIAGAVAWLLPLMTGLAIFRWRSHLPGKDTVTAAALLMGLALFVGQSRFALVGVLLVALLLVLLLLPTWRSRLLGVLFVGAIMLLEIMIFLNLLVPSAARGAAGGSLSARDENSVETRQDIWMSGIHMLLDHPLTGVGLSYYRYNPPRQQYPVPYFAENNLILPHAHNEWIQAGADFGFPGLIVFIGIQVSAGWMLLQSWRRGDAGAKALAAALGAGLLAHAAYAIGDAITLWDRFIFLYWWMLGLAAAQYVVVCRAAPLRAGQSVPIAPAIEQPVVKNSFVDYTEDNNPQYAN